MVLVPVAVAHFLVPIFIKKGRNVAINFQGKNIKTSGGIILFAAFCAAQPMYLFYRETEPFPHGLMIIYLGVITMLGLADDLWGDSKCKGFRGHLGKFWAKGKISTGLCKAAGGFFCGISISFLAGGGGWTECLLKGTFLALFSNFFNFLDTRPVRASGMFLIFSLVFMIFFKEICFTLFPLWGVLYTYLFWELNAKVMLGDAGAYFLGGALGFPLIFRFTTVWIALFIILLLFLHYYLEKYSLSVFLEKLKDKVECL